MAKSTIMRTTPKKDEEEDRLSSLPEVIICHILSFLTTKDAARTSVLSTMWRHLFLSVPKLIFDDSYTDCKNQSFINFVNRRFILCRAATISEFRLKCKNFPNPEVFNSWLTALVFGKAKVLDITSKGQADNFRPPSEFFRWETLVILKLCASNALFKIPERVCMKNLKVLSLQFHRVQFHHNNPCRLDDQAYPVLEDLNLENIRFEMETTATLEISIPSLKKLAIIDEEEDDYKRIDIDAPHLQHLKLNYYRYENIHLRLCESLISADFDQPFRHDSLQMAQSKIKILNKIKNVKELCMSYNFSKCFKQIRSHPLPEFPDLSYLNLSASSETMWSLLQQAPVLKILLYDMGHVGNYYRSPKIEPICFGQNLTEIRARNCQEGGAELTTMAAVMTYFLEHAAGLETMGIDSDRLRKIVEVIKPLSPHCQIE